MADREHLKIIVEKGVEGWNEWVQVWGGVASLSGANLSGADLSGADFGGGNLTGEDLIETNLSMGHLSGANLSGADLSSANLVDADLSRANLSHANLSGADLRGADLSGGHLSGAQLNRTDLSQANLTGADLNGVRLLRADLSRANLSGAELKWGNLRRANLSNGNLTRVDLSHANLSGADLSGADLGHANLTKTNLRTANLIGTSLRAAKLNESRLWETQRAGWSIKGVICEGAYWDRQGTQFTEYAPGEFERAFAEKPIIILKYPGGIQPVQLAMLPLLLEKLQAEHQGCRLHIRSVEDSGGGATVTITVNDTQGRDPETLQKEIQILRSKLEGYQRALEEKGHEVSFLQSELSSLRDRTYPLLLESYEQRVLESHQGREVRTVLFLDLTGYSKMDEEGQLGAVDSVRRTGQMVLEKHRAKYSNTWGDAIVAGFDKPGDGIVCACKLIEHLQVEGLEARIGPFDRARAEE